MSPEVRRELSELDSDGFAEVAVATGHVRACMKVARDFERERERELQGDRSKATWTPIDARYYASGGEITYYGVAIGEDYSFQPDAIFASEEAAEAWVAWQRSIWDEETEAGIPPSTEVFVLAVRQLEGVFWNCLDPVPEAL